MTRPARHGPNGFRRRVGFTLLEIIIVTAMIALFAGIAMIAVQGIYDQNRTKMMFPEAQQIGTALSIAHDDLQFYPRLHLLNQDLNAVSIQDGAETIIRPHMDSYGTFGASRRAVHVTNEWRGPYAAKSPSRLSQGHRSYVRVALFDQQTLSLQPLFQQQRGIDIAVVDWPSDTYGNPWMVYHVVREFENGEPRYRFALPGESADFLNAVVSYGFNGVPGGTRDTLQSDPGYFEQLLQARLFLESPDAAAADFGLRSFAAPGQFNLQNLTSEMLETSFFYPGEVEVAPGRIGNVGMLQEGSDDIIWNF